MLDLDCFKGVNDRYGHHTGDEMLRHVARILRGSIREEDIAVRLGGDEFLLVMPNVALEVAHRRGVEVVAAIAEADWDRIASGLAITSSLGLAAGHPRQTQELIVAADAALYRAKAAGRQPRAALKLAQTCDASRGSGRVCRRLWTVWPAPLSAPPHPAPAVPGGLPRSRSSSAGWPARTATRARR